MAMKGDEKSDLQKLVQKHPEDAKSLAEKMGDSASEYLLRVLKEERPDWYLENVEGKQGGIEWK